MDQVVLPDKRCNGWNNNSGWERQWLKRNFTRGGVTARIVQPAQPPIYYLEGLNYPGDGPAAKDMYLSSCSHCTTLSLVPNKCQAEATIPKKKFLDDCVRVVEFRRSLIPLKGVQ